MEINDLKNYNVEQYVDDDTKETYYVVDGELSAIDAIKLVANRLHVNKDNVRETRGYVIGDKMYFAKSSEKVLANATKVWSVSVERKRK